MKIHISNRQVVEELISNLTGTIAVISITDPDTPTVCDNCNNVLRLQFHDLDKIWPQLNEVTYFNDAMADAIIKFIIANKSTDHMIVHCEAGVARSPAIAAVINEYHNIQHTVFQKYCPNTMVLSILRARLKNFQSSKGKTND